MLRINKAREKQGQEDPREPLPSSHQEILRVEPIE